MKQNYESYLIPGAIAAAVLFAVYRIFGKSKEVETFDKDILKAKQTQKPTFSESVYNTLANRLYVAGTSNFGTDEKAIYSVFKLLKNDLDFLLLQKAFGTKRNEFSLQFSDMGGYLQSELNSEEIDMINKILVSKGIKGRV